MDKEYDSIYNTKLDNIIINRRDLDEIYSPIGSGCEGTIYQLDKYTAMKIYTFIDSDLLPNKYAKIELLGQIKDDSFSFPQLIVGFENFKKAGYTMHLIEPNIGCSTIDQLIYIKDQLLKIKVLNKACNAMERIHKKGICIGDIRGDNILINKDYKPIFVDTCNYSMDDFDFDIVPAVTFHYEYIFNKKCSKVDNDKFIFARLALQCFMNGTILSMVNSKSYYQQLIKLLDVNKQSKEVLKAIFSDSNDKPYISEILNEIDIDKPLFNKEQIYSLNMMIH